MRAAAARVRRELRTDELDRRGLRNALLFAVVMVVLMVSWRAAFDLGVLA